MGPFLITLAKAWTRVALHRLVTSVEEATAIATLVIEKNGPRLRDQWRQLGVLTGQGSTETFHPKVWYRYRYHRCVVLGNPWSAKLWRSQTMQLLLCSCTPFALSGRCEHEQCAAHLMAAPGQGTLDVPGLAPACAQRTRTGRPMKDPDFRHRGLSSAAVFGESQRAQVGNKRTVF